MHWNDHANRDQAEAYLHDKDLELVLLVMLVRGGSVWRFEVYDAFETGEDAVPLAAGYGITKCMAQCHAEMQACTMVAAGFSSNR